MKQVVSDLNPAELEWLRATLAQAAEFIGRYSPSDSTVTLASLDRAFANWLASEPVDTAVINKAINIVGVSFGQTLVDGLGLRWNIATDEGGTDLVVYGFPQKADLLVYPCNFVAKRWESRTSYFLESSYRDISVEVERRRQVDLNA